MPIFDTMTRGSLTSRASGDTCHADVVETLLGIARFAAAGVEIDDVLQHALVDVVRCLGADAGDVWRFDSGSGLTHPLFRFDARGDIDVDAPGAWTLPVDVLTHDTTTAIYSSDSAHDPRFDTGVRVLPHRSLLIQPFNVDGRIGGAFVVFWTRARHQFTVTELQLVEAVAAQAALGIERARLDADVRALQERLATLTTPSVQAERIRESERARLAREIHDELGQALTSLKIDLAQLAEPAGGGPAPIDVRQLSLAVDSMFAIVRRIASELRPRLLDDLGLLAALEWQVRDFATRTRVRCRFRCKGAPATVDEDRSVAIFRILQELLTNVARHAEATQVQVALMIGRAALRLEVQDNGRGMPGGSEAAENGLGLVGMKERAAAFGGTVAISGRSPSGTKVRVTIPIRDRQRTDPA